MPSAVYCPPYIKHVACRLRRLDTVGAGVCMTKGGLALLSFHSQLPKRKHENSTAVAVLRHKLYSGLAATLSHKAAPGSAVQLKQ